MNCLRHGSTLCRRNFSLVSLMTSVIVITSLPSSAASQQTSHASLIAQSIALPSSIVAVTDPTVTSLGNIAELDLKPPTEDKPQIMFNGRPSNINPSENKAAGSRKTNGRKPILQGLVYFPERVSMDPAAKS